MERIFAFKVLYGLCFTPADSEAALLRAFQNTPDRPEGLPEEGGYAWTLSYGVWRHGKELDQTIASLSRNWRVERMGKVEVTLLRIAVFELTRQRDVPPKAVINEAIELSKLFSDDKSRIFVNGILDATAKALESGSLAPPKG